VSKEYDVIIVGSGIGGATVANELLKNNDLDILLLEKVGYQFLFLERIVHLNCLLWEYWMLSMLEKVVLSHGALLKRVMKRM